MINISERRLDLPAKAKYGVMKTHAVVRVHPVETAPFRNA